MIFCTKCGAKHDDGAMFCSKCGTQLQSPAQENNQKTQKVFCYVVHQHFCKFHKIRLHFYFDCFNHRVLRL